MIEPIIIVGIAIACTAWYMQHIWRRRRARKKALHSHTGLEVLAARYARGDIDRAEYRRSAMTFSRPTRAALSSSAALRSAPRAGPDSRNGRSPSEARRGLAPGS